MTENKTLLEEWTKKSDQMLWSLTHDETDDDLHFTLYAEVVSEQTNENPHKCYSIRLLKRNDPKYINLAHKLVAENEAKLTKEEFKAVFGILEDEEQRQPTLGDQFALYFVR